MSYKLEEGKLMAYLYGELSYEEKKEIDELIKKHPEIREELNQLEDVRHIMGKFEDKEVIEPVITPEAKERIPYLKTIMAIAAAIMLIMITGYITKLNINFSDNQMIVQFGDTQPAETKPDPYESIARPTEDYTAVVTGYGQELQQQIDSLKWQIKTYADANQLISQRIDQSLSSNLKATKAQLAEYATQQQEANKNTILALFSESDNQQQQYINNLLAEYNEYLDGRRQQDIQFYIDGLRTIKEDYDLKQFETEQLLANLITTTGQDLPGNYQAGSK